MKRLLFIAILLIPVMVFAGSYTVTVDLTEVDSNTKYLTYACTGNSTGEIPATTTAITTNAAGNTGINLDADILGWYAEEIQVEPGGTAPDAAGLTWKDDMGDDFLDGNGSALIHATDTQSTYFVIDGLPAKRKIVGTMTLEDDGNQATANATYGVRIKLTSTP